MKSENGFVEILMIIIFIAIIILIEGVCISFKYGNTQTLEITIKDKYIKNYDKKSKYLVVDTEKNTYEITDLPFMGKWNSTDLYNELETGKTYKIQTSGIRNNFWSWYPNINRIEEIKINKGEN